jgi:mannose-6-phosphate isomerase-like protein (cupin superfamily)
MIDKINLAENLALITEHWRPKVVGKLNGQEVKLVKFRGEFIWHHHDEADELFLPIKGKMRVDFKDRTITLVPGEILVIPRGVEHRTAAEEEVDCLIFEPAGTRNTGNVNHPTLTAPTASGAATKRKSV